MPSDNILSILAAAITAAVTGRLGFELIRDTLAEDAPEVHVEVEPLLPLRGRWRRLLTLAPAHAFLLAVVFAGTFPVVMLLCDAVISFCRAIP